MKRILALLLACITLLSLASCGGESLAEPTETVETQETAGSKKPAVDTEPEMPPFTYVPDFDPNAPAKKILFLGGSITCGAGVSDYKYAWACRTFDAIGEKLFGPNVEMLNAAISGTGSLLAAFRLEEHVLKFCPDMVFIEFAVNDITMAKTNPELVVSALDYIVRALKQANPNVAVTFVYTTQSDGQNASKVHGRVASHYGIPEIDLREPLVSKIAKNEATWEQYLKDGAHPNSYGHKFYADLVTRAVLSDPERFLAPVKEADSIASIKLDSPHIEYAKDMAGLNMNGFSIQDAKDKEKTLDEMEIDQAAVSDTVGSTITYEFEGNTFAVYHRIDANGGAFSVAIDGKTLGTASCQNSGSNSYLSRFYKTGLGEGKHTVTITVTQAEPGKKEVAIAGFCVA
ncbi:MAG: SGNH/GDSL hydrolase family protein [Clostridia bacterium]|nr:SGNH/GDSL hydrolase family protein [Clostridia bacterium]